MRPQSSVNTGADSPKRVTRNFLEIFWGNDDTVIRSYVNIRIELKFKYSNIQEFEEVRK